MCCCSWRTLWTLTLTTERTPDINYWNVWSVDENAVQSLIHYYRIFRTQLYVHLKKRLNCCLFWTTCAISTKFARYVDWILVCKLCKFGKYICYNSTNIEFFLGVPFFADNIGVKYKRLQTTNIQLTTVDVLRWKQTMLYKDSHKTCKEDCNVMSDMSCCLDFGITPGISHAHFPGMTLIQMFSFMHPRVCRYHSHNIWLCDS